MKKNKKKKNKRKKQDLITAFKKKFFPSKYEDVDSTFSIFEVIIIIIISILFGVILGYIITGSNSSASDKNLREIVNVYNNITHNYYGDYNKDKLSDAAVKGMIESLNDPYTNYMDSTTAKDFNKTVDGSFVGVGVTVMCQEDGYHKIIEVMKDTPAEKAGLKVDDILMEVNGKDIVENPKAFDNITKGKVGSKVKLTIKRGNEKKVYTIKRGVIELKSVSNHIFDYEDLKIGYVKIDNVASNTYNQFKKAMNRFDRNRIDALVIDVRNNPGGHLKQTREILSIFFDRKTVLYQIKTKDSTKKVYALNSGTKSYPVAVLVNSGSASAAEILASAFKDNYEKAIVVGTATYGKGTVQKSQVLSSGNSIKYTTEKWLTSKGEWLEANGVEPDLVVSATEEYYKNPTYDNDVQLQEALKSIKESNK